MQAAGKAAAPITEDEIQLSQLTEKIRETAAWLPEYTNLMQFHMAANNPLLYGLYYQITGQALMPHVRPLLTILPAILYDALSRQHTGAIGESAIEAAMRLHMQDRQLHTERNLDELYRLCPKLANLLHYLAEPFRKMTPQEYHKDSQKADELIAVMFAAYLNQSIQENLEAMWEKPVR